MASPYRRARIFTHFPALLLHPYHFTCEEAAEKLGMIVQTTVPIFEVPTGTRGMVIHAAKSDDGGYDGYSVAIAWQLAPARPQVHDPTLDAGLTPLPEPLIDWFTRSEYERYLIEITPS
jgi:hypothetical protein